MALGADIVAAGPARPLVPFAQTEAALEGLRAEVAARPNTELREVTVRDAEGNEGSLVMQAVSEALADEPRARVAGIVVVSDGQIHDMAQMPAVPAPVHLLMTGHDTDWDRRLIVRNAPAFAILNEEFHLTLRIEDQGDVPEGIGGAANLALSVDGSEPQTYRVPVGQDIDLPVVLPHGGMNVIQFTLEDAPGELTDRNNSAVLQINGVRDRLRVLLVSGEPHAGERTWRNLLKSDSSVDLVHFTILRPPEKQDGVPVTELSLIAFPTRELFLEKIDEFDLIIFDRYKRRGILPVIYLDNIRQYVMDGGAVLVAAGPDFAGATSIYRTPLSEIIPAEPTARVYEEGFKPLLTDLGRRHPVTEGLDAWGAENAPEGETAPHWGRWFRMIDLDPKSGETVMSGPEDKPLLVLDRVGEGRVALLASDHAWLWNRGFEGGGPQLELLRRLAHWMMKEPELEEEALWAEAEGQSMTVIRRTLEDGIGTITVTGPGGESWELEAGEVSPGRFEAEFDAPEIGLYRITDGDLDAVIALGPSAPREFEQTIASGEAIAPLVEGTRGGVMALEDGMPDLRETRAQPVERGAEPGKAAVHGDAVRLGFADHAVQLAHLKRDLVERRGDRRPVAAALAVIAGETEPGDGRQPFLELAVEPVLAVAGEQLQQADDQRPGEPQKRGGEGRAHAAELGFQPRDQPSEHRRGILARGRGQRADRVDHRRNRGGKPVEGAEEAQEDQKVAQIARDVARLVDAGGDRVEDRARRGRADLHPAAARPHQRGERGKEPRRPCQVNAGALGGKALDPADRGNQLRDLPETGQHADHEDHADGAVEIGIGGEHAPDPRQQEPGAGPEGGGDGHHHEDLADRLGKLGRGTLFGHGHGSGLADCGRPENRDLRPGAPNYNFVTPKAHGRARPCRHPRAPARSGGGACSPGSRGSAPSRRWRRR
ncbi:hypothetical protein [Mangrovicoccus ximenensis]|uniref:hypothetical protein n=1 Tax=Mangrovicoccus ximenensis TaxID=1911570 RepID=UPI0038B26071